MTKPVCSDCDNAYTGARGVWCEVYREFILSETTAEDCPSFDDGNEKPRLRLVEDER